MSTYQPLTELQNLKIELQRLATQTTAQYVLNHMATVQSVETTFQIHDRAVEQISIDNGLVLEFGVFEGRTINYLAEKKDWVIDGFDSFEGLPEPWRDGFAKGVFGLSSLPEVLPNVRLHKGWFEDSIPIFLESLAGAIPPISYLHVDCDLYSSTKTIFKFLKPYIVRGTVIVFDEYFNYPGWEKGEYLAFQEFVQQHNVDYEYITYNALHEQVAVLVRSIA